MLDEHVDRIVQQPDPPVAAGIVGDLLVHQAGADRREQVDVARVVDAECRQVGDDATETLLGDA